MNSTAAASNARLIARSLAALRDQVLTELKDISAEVAALGPTGFSAPKTL
jgi:hypothetical protein